MADTMFDPDDEELKRKPMIAAPTPVKPGLALPGIGPAIPSGVAPITPAKDTGQLGADKTELARLESTGSGVSQLQRKHPVLGTFAKIADVIGSIAAPGAAAQIPGTTAHHSLLVNKERGQIKGDIANMEGEAQAQQEQAKAQSLINPPAKEKPAGSTVETGDGVFQWNPETNKYDTKVGPPKTQAHTLSDPKAGYAQAISDAITNGRDPNNDPHVIAWKQAMDNIAKQEKPDSPEQQFIDEHMRTHPGATISDAVRAYGAASQQPQRDPRQMAVGPDGKVIEIHPGMTIPQGTKSVTGDLTNKPTADEQRRADLASNLNENLTQLEGILQRRPDLFGPAAGRLTGLRGMIGTSDPDVAALKTIQEQMGMAMVGAHAMRNAQHVETAANSIVNSLHNEPEAVAGAIAAARNSLKTFQSDAERNTNRGSTSGPARDLGPAPQGKEEGATGTLPDGTKVKVQGGRLVAQ